MNERPEERDDAYAMECNWCGAKIRDINEDTTGVCLKCFYQMLINHLQSQKRSAYGDFVSDR
ncbi:MAG: hypothetical protein LC794_16900 [Acidobacteria bacterium]|nr:hypothetical protein [Acidobacteriota bacterium]